MSKIPKPPESYVEAVSEPDGFFATAIHHIRSCSSTAELHKLALRFGNEKKTKHLGEMLSYVFGEATSLAAEQHSMGKIENYDKPWFEAVVHKMRAITLKDWKPAPDKMVQRHYTTEKEMLAIKQSLRGMAEFHRFALEDDDNHTSKLIVDTMTHTLKLPKDIFDILKNNEQQLEK